jgi:hypothetical protein
MKLRHFTLRDLFWLILVVALATGWGLDRFKLEAARRNEAAERQKALIAARQQQYAADVARAATALQEQDFDATNRLLHNGGVSFADDVQYFPAGQETRPVAGNVEPAELRTWSRGDFTLEARFVRLDGGNVILRKAAGAEVSVPLEELSPADQSVVTMTGPAGESTSIP